MVVGSFGTELVQGWYRILGFRSRIWISPKGLILCCKSVLLSLFLKDRHKKAAPCGRQKIKKWWWEMDSNHRKTC